MPDRPNPSHLWPEIPEGHEVVATPDPDWQIDPIGRPCRRAFGRGTKACGRPSGAVMLRGDRPQPWGYCPDHMYRRWVEDGKVMKWILREKGSGDG